MRGLAGFAGFHLLLAFSGAALLHAAGLVRATPRALAAAAGPAFFCGVALVFPLEIAMAVAGIPVTLPTFAATAVGSGVLLFAVPAILARRAGRPDPEPEESQARDPLDVWTLRIAAVAFAVFLVVGARAYAHLPAFEDNAHIWSIKALALFYYDGLDTEVFSGSGYVLSHPDYPILQPLLEATLYRARADVDLRLSHLELWIVLGSFIWTAAFLLRSHVRPLLWLAPLAALVVAPGVIGQVALGYADVTVGCFAAAGVLSLGLWVQRRRAGHLLVAAVLLGAAANTKNEGLAALAAATVAAGGVLIAERRRPSVAPLLGAGAVLLAAVLPWRIWALGNAAAAGPDDAAGPAQGALDRLLTAMDGVATHLAHQARWVWIVPAAIVVAGTAALDRRWRGLAGFYAAMGLLMVAALVGTYWVGDDDLPSELTGSVSRTVTVAIFMAAVATAHLLSLRAAPPAGNEPGTTASRPGDAEP